MNFIDQLKNNYEFIFVMIIIIILLAIRLRKVYYETETKYRKCNN